MNHKFLLIVSWFIRTSLFFLPNHKYLNRFRGFLYSLFLPRCGKNFQVSSDVMIINLENLYVGNDVYLAPGVIINAIDKIYLEDEVMIGFNSVLVSGNHTLSNSSYRFSTSYLSPISIGKGSWIAANCTITAGTVIDDSVLIGANSLVRGRCLKNSIYAGNPATFIKSNLL
jgi:acetyltransferase-like isoleucine patch superfamily enzyme